MDGSTCMAGPPDPRLCARHSKWLAMQMNVQTAHFREECVQPAFRDFEKMLEARATGFRSRGWFNALLGRILTWPSRTQTHARSHALRALAGEEAGHHSHTALEVSRVQSSQAGSVHCKQYQATPWPAAMRGQGHRGHPAQACSRAAATSCRHERQAQTSAQPHTSASPSPRRARLAIHVDPLP